MRRKLIGTGQGFEPDAAGWPIQKKVTRRELFSEVLVDQKTSYVYKYGNCTKVGAG